MHRPALLTICTHGGLQRGIGEESEDEEHGSSAVPVANPTDGNGIAGASIPKPLEDQIATAVDDGRQHYPGDDLR